MVDASGALAGVVSKKDQSRCTDAPSSTKVVAVMSKPAIAISPTTSAAITAALCLKHKIRRVPVVNSDGRVVGMVTRTDLFKVLGDDAV